MLFYKEIPFYCKNIESKLKTLASKKAQEIYVYVLEGNKDGDIFTARTHVGNRQGFSIHIAIRAETQVKGEHLANYKIEFSVGLIRKWLSMAGLFAPLIALFLIYYLPELNTGDKFVNHWIVFLWLSLNFAGSIYSVIDFGAQKKYYLAIISNLLDVRIESTKLRDEHLNMIC